MEETTNTINEALVLEWTTAVEALDSDTIQELFDIQPDLLWTPLLPLSHLETDFSHFILRLEGHKLLGTSIRPVYALHHILYDYGVPDDEWALERIELVEFILKSTKGNELNTCFWGGEENSVMHLAYFLNQPELIQQLKEYGALATVPNKFGHLPLATTIIEDTTNSVPEVKLLINKSKSTTTPKDRTQPNSSDRFKRLRELAESPSGVNSNRTLTERQNSTRRHFRPGHLEERKRRVLSEEEEAELEKQRLKRQKEVEMLAQRSAVKNNPLFKKFEEQQQQQQPTKRAPSISAVSAVRDRKKLLDAADQVRRSSRVINSLKQGSYVSSSIFRQTQEADATSGKKSLKVPTLAELRGGPSPVVKDASLNVNDNAEQEEEVEKKTIVLDNPEGKIVDKLAVSKSEEDKKEEGHTDNTVQISNVSDSHSDDNDKLTSNKKKEDSTTTYLDRKSNDDNHGVTENEIESLSIGKLGDRGLSSNLKTNKTEIDIASSKVKEIVNVHEHLNDEEEIEIYSVGKKFAVWKKNGTGQEEEEEEECLKYNKTGSIGNESPTADNSKIVDRQPLSPRSISTKERPSHDNEWSARERSAIDRNLPEKDQSSALNSPMINKLPVREQLLADETQSPSKNRLAFGKKSSTEEPSDATISQQLSPSGQSTSVLGDKKSPFDSQITKEKVEIKDNSKAIPNVEKTSNVSSSNTGKPSTDNFTSSIKQTSLFSNTENASAVVIDQSRYKNNANTVPVIEEYANMASSDKLSTDKSTAVTQQSTQIENSFATKSSTEQFESRSISQSSAVLSASKDQYETRSISQSTTVSTAKDGHESVSTNQSTTVSALKDQYKTGSISRGTTVSAVKNRYEPASISQSSNVSAAKGRFEQASINQSTSVTPTKDKYPASKTMADQYITENSETTRNVPNDKYTLSVTDDQYTTNNSVSNYQYDAKSPSTFSNSQKLNKPIMSSEDRSFIKNDVYASMAMAFENEYADEKSITDTSYKSTDSSSDKIQSHSTKKLPTNSESQSHSTKELHINTESQSYSTKKLPIDSVSQSYSTKDQSISSESQSYSTKDQSISSESQSYSTKDQPINSESQSYSTNSESQSYSTKDQPINSESQSYSTKKLPINSESQSYSTKNQPINSESRLYSIKEVPIDSSKSQLYTETEEQHSIFLRNKQNIYNKPTSTYLESNKSPSSLENETSTIPTMINQVESNHDPTSIINEKSDNYETKSRSVMDSSKNTQDHGDNFDVTSTYHTPSTVEQESNRELHLEINTNKSQMMIEEESDEDEATTPTMANPHTYKKKQQEESEESEDEESRHEWKSAYDQLMSNQQEIEFEDDILMHHNNTIQGKNNISGDRLSLSSDMDETSILQALSFQNEARMDHYQQQVGGQPGSSDNTKRESGSQRNHWSTGIQQADALKRESLVSREGSTVSEEQWYDPDDDWNEQEEMRRQSLLATGFHVPPHEDYFYKKSRESDSSLNTNSETKYSNSTENTNHDDDDEDGEDSGRKKYSEEEYYSTQLHTTTETTTTAAPPVPSVAEEEDDYYSTNLHQQQKASNKARGESSYYHGGQSDNDQDEEGEIVVFMDQFSEQKVKGREIQKNTSQASEQNTSAFHTNNNARPVVAQQQQQSQPLTAATITNFSSSSLSVNQQREDDEISLIKVPSRTVAIVEIGSAQEDVPHDPNHPRVEDISHYMNKLPAFENPNNSNNQVQGGSAFDTAALEGGGGLENESVVMKRAICTSQQQPVEQNRGIPNAHEINYDMMAENRRVLGEEGRGGGGGEDHDVSVSSMEVTEFGKMYIGVSGAHNMLLPLPKEITYVRCVISDGEYEYMSRYEILGHQILMDYECVIDTRPGMIITVSLHVRPDYHVKPRTGWSRWFTSIRKQKEHLSGYVHPEDGAIGQTRFAVDHMAPGCYKKTYEAHFDCFNSWYARTNRERARREQFGDDEDFLKIVGKLNVEMLYLPVSDPSVQVPRSLRECDLTLKIRQWHETCWQSGYLSTRRQGLKVWERHYYRLIGSQLIAYTTEGGDRQVWDHFNMSDVIRLSAAADKVLVTLMDDEDDDKVFGTRETIHAENHKGFFRLAFPEYHLDCVSDDLEESEEWVKTLKSMIGRVPLRLPFSD